MNPSSEDFHEVLFFCKTFCHILLIKISAIMIPRKDHIKYIKMQYSERRCIEKILHGI